MAVLPVLGPGPPPRGLTATPCPSPRRGVHKPSRRAERTPLLDYDEEVRAGDQRLLGGSGTGWGALLLTSLQISPFVLFTRPRKCVPHPLGSRQVCDAPTRRWGRVTPVLGPLQPQQPLTRRRPHGWRPPLQPLPSRTRLLGKILPEFVFAGCGRHTDADAYPEGKAHKFPGRGATRGHAGCTDRGKHARAITVLSSGGGGETGVRGPRDQLRTSRRETSPWLWPWGRP